MIIVEGPDGAGKTLMVERLADRLGFPVAPRVVASDTSAMVDLKTWVEDNVQKGFQNVIFDRHRLISDPIYQAVLPWRPENSDFYDPLWFGQQMAEFIAIQPLIIYCLPPKTEVLKNVALEETDNSRIMEFAGKLYDAYVARASADLWLMEAVIYDYTTDTPDGWISSWLNVQLKRRERARQSSAN